MCEISFGGLRVQTSDKLNKNFSRKMRNQRNLHKIDQQELTCKFRALLDANIAYVKGERMMTTYSAAIFSVWKHIRI